MPMQQIFCEECFHSTAVSRGGDDVHFRLWLLPLAVISKAKYSPLNHWGTEAGYKGGKHGDPEGDDASGVQQSSGKTGGVCEKLWVTSQRRASQIIKWHVTCFSLIAYVT
jgi:hypothetical protein